MANKFIEKHKRKSVLAMLLLLFTGRTKYIVIALLVIVTSLPFVVSGELVSRFFEMPAVSGTLRMMGLGSVVSALNPKYSTEFVKAAIDRAAAESAQTSYWNRLMGAVGSILPCGAGCEGGSSLSMVKGADLFQPEAAGKAAAKTRPGQVKGAVSAEEVARGEGADTVDLEGILNNPAGAGGNGLYGDLMGASLADRYSAGDSAGPYANRSLISGPGGVVDHRAGMFANVMNQAGGRIPVPVRAQRVSAKMTGRASGFSWKNVGYQTRNNNVDKKLGSKRPMFQLAETFSMAGSAIKKDTAYEYQAAYTGSTYDGNDVNDDILLGPAEGAPIAPGTPLTGADLNTFGNLAKAAKECTDSQALEGVKMADDAAQIDKTYKTLGSKPKCCDSGAVDAWNGKLMHIQALCLDFNANAAILSQKCGGAGGQMTCNYTSEMVSHCSELNCWLAMLFIIFGVLCFGITAVFITAASFGVVSFGGGNISAKFQAMLGTIASGGNKDQTGDKE